MASYIGKVQLNGANDALVGSTMYGICKTAAATELKTVTTTDDSSGKFINANFDSLVQGITIYVKFVNGNSASGNNVKLQVGSTTAQPVKGNFICEAGSVIGFTLDETEEQNWVVNSEGTTYTFAEGSTNGTISVTQAGGTATDVRVKGLKNYVYNDLVTDIANNTTSTDAPTAGAVAAYVATLTGGLAGISGAMHFRGVATVAVTDGGSENPTIENYDFSQAVGGDVVLYGQQEYVWTGSQWELLGDESSYALKSSTDTITEVGTFTPNTLPTLTPVPTTASSVSVTNGSAADLETNDVSIPNVTQMTTASVSGGVLNITLGAIAATPITVKEVKTFTANTPTAVTSTPVNFDAVSNWNAGTQAALNTHDTTVVVPVAPNP